MNRKKESAETDDSLESAIRREIPFVRDVTLSDPDPKDESVEEIPEFPRLTIFD